MQTIVHRTQLLNTVYGPISVNAEWRIRYKQGLAADIQGTRYNEVANTEKLCGRDTL